MICVLSCIGVLALHSSVPGLEFVNRAGPVLQDGITHVVPPAIERELVKAFTNVDAPVLFDLPDAYVQSQPFGLGAPHFPNDVNVLGLFARFKSRKLERVAGAYVVYRENLQLATKYPGDHVDQTIEWLAELHDQRPEQFAQLFGGGIELADLDDEGQSILGPLWSTVKDSGEGLAEGVPIIVKMGVFPSLLRNGVGDGLSASRGGLHAVVSNAKPKLRKPQAAVPFIPVTDGELDFGSGSVLRVAELVNAATKKFRFACAQDFRYSGLPIFVKGKFSKERIMQALRLLGSGGPALLVRERPTRAEILALKHRMDEGVLSAMLNVGDERIASLKGFLDEPNSVDPVGLAKFGYSTNDIASATSVSLSLQVIMTSNVGDVAYPNGDHRTVPARIGAVLD